MCASTKQQNLPMPKPPILKRRKKRKYEAFDANCSFHKSYIKGSGVLCVEAQGSLYWEKGTRKLVVEDFFKFRVLT